MRVRARALVAAAAAVAACSPTTRRPAFTPMPESRSSALELAIPEATRRLAAALTAAGMPVTRTELRDGYVETAWFDTATARPVTGRGLGTGVVRVRGWVDPSEYGYSQMTVEAVYRPAADPSLAPRELERPVPYDHPTRRRVREALASMGARAIGDEPDSPTVLAAARQRRENRPEKASTDSAVTTKGARRAPDSLAAAIATSQVDTTGRDSTPSAPAPRDSTRRDSIRAPAGAGAQPPATQPSPGATPRRTPRPTLPGAMPPTPALVDRGAYAIQVAAAPTRPEADAIAVRLRSLGEEPQVIAESGLFKVRTAGYATRAAASARLPRIRAAFAGAFVLALR